MVVEETRLLTDRTWEG